MSDERIAIEAIMPRDEYGETGKRTCGSCRLCCKLVSTWEVGTGPDGQPYEFKKARGKWCEHAGPKGCGIYTSPAKPWTCRIWACVWRMGFGPDAHRPDRVHFVPSLERLNGEVHFVVYAGRLPYSLVLQQWLGTFQANPAAAAVMVIEPDGGRQRWHRVHGHQLVARQASDDGRYPEEPAQADPQRAAMRHLLGEKAASGPSIDVAEIEAAMLRELGEGGRGIAWTDYVKSKCEGA